SHPVSVVVNSSSSQRAWRVESANPQVPLSVGIRREAQAASSSASRAAHSQLAPLVVDSLNLARAALQVVEGHSDQRVDHLDYRGGLCGIIGGQLDLEDDSSAMLVHRQTSQLVEAAAFLVGASAKRLIQGSL